MTDKTTLDASVHVEVELPAPTRVWPDGARAWKAGPLTLTAELGERGRPHVRLNGRVWLLDELEAGALAELAAVHTARRMAAVYQAHVVGCVGCAHVPEEILGSFEDGA